MKIDFQCVQELLKSVDAQTDSRTCVAIYDKDSMIGMAKSLGGDVERYMESYYTYPELSLPSYLFQELVKHIDYCTKKGWIESEWSFPTTLTIFGLTSKGYDYIANGFREETETRAMNINFGDNANANFVQSTFNSGNITTTVGTPIAELETVFAQRPAEEQPQLQEILDIVRKMNSGEPIQRGRLSKLKDFIEERLEIQHPTAKAILDILMG